MKGENEWWNKKKQRRWKVKKRREKGLELWEKEEA